VPPPPKGWSSTVSADLRSRDSTPSPISSTAVRYRDRLTSKPRRRFHNEGNRASFVAHPEVYGPQFGGYDPVDVARGVTFAGNPRFWVIADERLYLFGLEAHRDAFAADPGPFLQRARARWPKLQQSLAQ